MPGTSKYRIHDIVNVFRSIARLVHNTPQLLDVVGVFRVGGSKSTSQELLQHLIQSQFDWMLLKSYVHVENKIDSDLVHNVLTILNLALKDITLLDATDRQLSPFAKELHELLDSDRSADEKNEAAMIHLDQFINKLLLSNSIDYQRVGEILYHYCYLMHIAATYETTNKMGAHNLAIIMSPHFISELELFHSNDLLRLTQFSMEKLTPVLELYIKDQRTAHHFSVRHADKLEHLKETHQKIINKLAEMQAACRRYTIEPMKAFMLQSQELKAQINSLQQNLKTWSLEKTMKKQIKKQLHELQLQHSELELRIAPLKEQIEEMDCAHASLLDEMEKVLLSITRLSPIPPPHLAEPKSHQEMEASSSTSQVEGVLQFGVFRDSPLSIAASSTYVPLSIEDSEPEDSEPAKDSFNKMSSTAL